MGTSSGGLGGHNQSPSRWDEELFRDMLTAVLSSQADIEVVGSASNGQEAIHLAGQLGPTVVLMDIELGGGLNGIEAGQIIKAQPPHPGVVILSHHKDRQYVANLPLEQASGWSYLLKGNVKETDVLMRAIRGVAWGLMTVDREILEQLTPRPGTAVGRLTEMQCQALTLLAQGYTDAEVGEALGMPETPAREEVNAIFQALGLGEDEPAVARVKAVLAYLQETKIS